LSFFFLKNWFKPYSIITFKWFLVVMFPKDYFVWDAIGEGITPVVTMIKPAKLTLEDQGSHIADPSTGSNWIPLSPSTGLVWSTSPVKISSGIPFGKASQVSIP
jgi:hypothetical protein